MNHIYFLYNTYTPNTAVSNRMLAYLSSLDKMKISIRVIFFLPDSHRSKVKMSFKYVTFEYYWDRFYLNNHILKYISYYFYTQLFKHRLTKGDKVYIYGEDYLAYKTLGVKGVDVFYEKTECPEVALSFNRLYHPTLESHLELCKRVKALFVISQNLKDYYIEKGISEKCIHTINIIVDPERFASVIKDEKNEKYIAYCGTAANNKDGVNDLIKAFAIVSRTHPDVKLYIIGPIPSKNDASENYQLIEKLHIKHKVVLTGVVTAEQMPSLLRNARVLALARPQNMISKYGFATKLGEYLLSGNPVVVTAVGDFPRFLKDGESAYMAPPGDVQAFADRVNSALDKPEEAKQIGLRGREVALKSFDAFKETKKLIDIITG